MINDIDTQLIRRSFEIALQARQNGSHPFGALLAAADHTILIEAENTVVIDTDCTGHAETNLMRMASQRYSADYLAQCSVYTSTEPCVMCAGAIFWGNVRRVVYGLDSDKLYHLIGDDPTAAVLYLPCRSVYTHARHEITVVGPLLQEEAERVHHGFWD